MRAPMLAVTRIGLAVLLAMIPFVARAQVVPGQPQNAFAINRSSGVQVDAQGVLRDITATDRTGQLILQRIAAARAAHDQQLMAGSQLRKISLNRLEKELAKRIADGAGPDVAMLHLAGLTRVQYVFYYPETNDIVLAGPAEGFVSDLAGRVRGIQSGRPIVLLDDLAAALRAYPAQGRGVQRVGCSIDPTQQGLTAMAQTVGNLQRQLQTAPSPQQVQQIVLQLQQALGPQDITVTGISPKTHAATVIIEADYRMKLIAIGLEKPPVRLTSYVDRDNPAAVSRNALKRWWFVPNYECVRVSDDKLAMELVGYGVKLVGEDELVTADGQRQGVGQVDPAAKAFADEFTRVYPDLAARSPVYAQMRNIIDLLVAAAFIQQQDYYGQAGWKAEVFCSEQKLPIETYNAPKQVDAACNAVWKGRRLVTPIGGVTIEPREALSTSNLLQDEDDRVKNFRGKIDLSGLTDGQWWWD
jgi:hypothetical protein